jgi:hypothetical protein
MTTAEAGDDAPAPFALAAFTVHVYDFPLDKPLTTIGDPAPDAEPETPEFDETHAAE